MFALLLVLLTPAGEIMIPPQTPVFREEADCQAKGAEIAAAMAKKPEVGHIFVACSEAIVVDPGKRA